MLPPCPLITQSNNLLNILICFMNACHKNVRVPQQKYYCTNCETLLCKYYFNSPSAYLGAPSAYLGAPSAYLGAPSAYLGAPSAYLVNSENKAKLSPTLYSWVLAELGKKGINLTSPCHDFASGGLKRVIIQLFNHILGQNHKLNIFFRCIFSFLS